MESVEVRFGRGDKRRTLGWLEVGEDGFLAYLPHVVKLRGTRRIRRQWPDGTYQVETPEGHVVMKVVEGKSLD